MSWWPAQRTIAEMVNKSLVDVRWAPDGITSSEEIRHDVDFRQNTSCTFPVSVYQIERGPLHESYNRMCRLGGGQIVEVQFLAEVTSKPLPRIPYLGWLDTDGAVKTWSLLTKRKSFPSQATLSSQENYGVQLDRTACLDPYLNAT